ncbi:MAG: HNH endonuclease [Bacillales bacterium]|nr:HNH endonuclease [Bacillales bacterium]
MERLDIQKIESYWINHDENKKRLKYREWELLHSRHNADDLNANLRGNRISNPTEQKAAALTDDELYRNLNKIVQSIEQIYEQLDEDLKTIVNMRYWDKCRRLALERDSYLCQDCLKQNILTPADMVHHIKELKDYPHLSLTLSNLVSLCNGCHNKKHIRTGRKEKIYSTKIKVIKSKANEEKI